MPLFLLPLRPPLFGGILNIVVLLLCSEKGNKGFCHSLDRGRIHFFLVLSTLCQTKKSLPFSAPARHPECRWSNRQVPAAEGQTLSYMPSSTCLYQTWGQEGPAFDPFDRRTRARHAHARPTRNVFEIPPWFYKATTNVSILFESVASL